MGRVRGEGTLRDVLRLVLAIGGCGVTMWIYEEMRIRFRFRRLSSIV
jgi:hypothetical protein